MENVDFLNLQYIFYKIYQFFTVDGIGDFKSFMDMVLYYWPTAAIIALILSIILAIWIILLMIKIKKIKELEEKIYGAVITKEEMGEIEVKNERWIHVLNLLDSESQSDWRTAILESDIILDEMSIKMGYHGENLGERLQGIEKSDFITIEKAWEAHKVRNMIAHEGSNFALSKREAKRIIDLYRQVFEEFQFI